jgi:twitching motility protein PilT
VSISQKRAEKVYESACVASHGGQAMRLRHTLQAGNPGNTLRWPLVRLDYSPLSQKDIDEVLDQILTEEQLKSFQERHEFDVSYAVAELSRFRVNICREMGSVRLVFRLIPFEIPTIQELGLPLVLQDICQDPHELALVTGRRGAAIDTLASMITYINLHYRSI